MLLRDSQIKFHPPDDTKLTLRIVSTIDGSHPCLSFCPLLKALEDSDQSGATAKKIEALYRQSYTKLASVSREGMELLQDIFRVTDNDTYDNGNPRSLLLKLAIRLKGDNIFPESYLDSILSHYLARLAKSTRTTDPFKIPIPGSHCNLGLADDNEILDEGEVYIPGQKRETSSPVLIYRFPIIHIGDIQRATALSDKTVQERLESAYPNDSSSRFAALERMDSVIFFSLKDDPPLPNRLSGGDLDGDHFEILTEKCDLWDPKIDETSTFRNEADEIQRDDHKESPDDEKDSSDNPSDKSDSKDFDIGSLATFIGQYIRYDCFDELEAIFMSLADRKQDGMKDKDVKELARWLSQAVDFAKNGKKVDLNELFVTNPEFKVQMKPHFQRPVFQSLGGFDDASSEYYPSSKLLGRIYQINISTTFPELKAIDNSGLQEILATVWKKKQEELAEAWEKKREENKKQKKNWKGKLRPDIHYMPEISMSGEDIDSRLEPFLHKEMKDYRDYLKEQNIAESSEIDIFMQRRLDDYPRSHIQRLADGVLEMLADNKIVSRTTDYQFKLGECPRDDAEQVYKIFLYRAW